jgi:hypothetical protein
MDIYFFNFTFIPNVDSEVQYIVSNYSVLISIPSYDVKVGEPSNVGQYIVRDCTVAVVAIRMLDCST